MHLFLVLIISVDTVPLCTYLKVRHLWAKLKINEALKKQRITVIMDLFSNLRKYTSFFCNLKV